MNIERRTRQESSESNPWRIRIPNSAIRNSLRLALCGPESLPFE